MTNRQESKNTMLLAVRDFLSANTSITATLPNFAVIFLALTNIIMAIQEHATQQILNRTGIYNSKKQLRKKLVETTADISRKVQAYAAFANKLVLLAETKLLESDLTIYSDTKLRVSANGLYNKVQCNIDALEPYYITQESQAEFLNLIEAFDDAIPNPRLGIVEKKQNTSELKIEFMVADKALESMDKLIEIVRLSQPSFYVGYKSVRKLTVTGNSRLAIKGTVIDAESKLGLMSVKLSFILEDNGTTTSAANGQPAVTKITAKKGGFNIKTLSPGIYSVTANRIGYIRQQIKIAVSQGVTTQMKIELHKM